MGAVTVTLGFFVSCKDTNGDWKEEFGKTFATNASLQQAMQQHQADIARLQALINQLQEEVGKCECDPVLMQKLKAFMEEMNKADITPDELKNMKELLELVQNNYQYIYNFVTNVGITQAQLDSAMNVLRDEMQGGQGSGCDCDLSKIDSIEKVAIQALNLAQDASNRLVETDSIARAAAEAAKAAADVADQAAKDAKAAADAAKQAGEDASAANQKAQSALDLANELKEIANAADALSKENKESIDKINNEIVNINNHFVSISDSLQNVYKYADSILVVADANKMAIELLDSTVKADKAILDELKDVTIPGINEQISKLSEKVGGMSEKLDKLGDDLTNLSTILYNKVDSLGSEIENLKPEITKLYTYADANLDKAKAYTDLEIALLRAELNGLDVDLEPLRKELGDSIFNLREDMNDAITNLNNALSKALTDSVNNLSERIDENTLMIGEVNTKLDSIAEDFKDSLAQLRSDLTDLEKRVKKNEDDIKDIFGQLESLKENLKRMVTGIIVQGTVNPAFGTLSLPVNVQSNVLLTYYGDALTDIQFPTNSTANYVDDRFVLSWKELNLLGLTGSKPIFKAGDRIMQNDYYNAGTMYLTVNPNTVDFSKLQLSLVNSQDVESYIKLGELKRSDKVLQFGYSRAADNGFYECYANLAPEDVAKVQKINVNTSGLKDDIKEIINKRTVTNLKGLAIDLAEVVKSLKLDASAVKCEWDDADGQKHAVYSNYSVAATAVKPLPLTWGKDFNYKTVPGYESAVNLLDRVSNRLHRSVHTVFKELNSSDLVKHVSNLTIRDIEIADLTEDQLAKFRVSIDTTIVVDGLSYHLDMNEAVNVPVKFSTDVNVPIKIQQDVAVDLSAVTVSTPTIVVTVTNSNDGTAVLAVPVKNAGDIVIGQAVIDLDDLNVQANGGTITLDGTAVAHLDVDKNQTITVSVDETVSATVNIDKWVQFGNYKKVGDSYVEVGPGQGDCKLVRIWVTKDLSDAAESLWGTAQTSLGSVNDMLRDLRQIVTDVNNMLDKINSYEAKIDDKIDSYKDKVLSYMEKVNAKLVNFVNNINLRLQPVMLATDANGTKFLSEAKEYPSVMNNNLDLIATTWTLELVAPLAKKHVGITDVINGDKSAKADDANCLAELNRVNGLEKVNEVLPGDIMRINATGLKSGYVYEIAYSGLDFHGKIATRKFYIKIK